MTKPIHEQEWTRRSNYVKFGPPDGMEHFGHAEVYVMNDADRARYIALIAAAPDMARALLRVAHLRCDKERPPCEPGLAPICGACVVCDARTALRKAKVLP